MAPPIYRPNRAGPESGRALWGPDWKTIPAWFVYGDENSNIPAEGLAFMAQRAHPKKTVGGKGASHVVMVSHPETVARLIEKAAKTVQPWDCEAQARFRFSSNRSIFSTTINIRAITLVFLRKHR